MWQLKEGQTNNGCSSYTYVVTGKQIDQTLSAAHWTIEDVILLQHLPQTYDMRYHITIEVKYFGGHPSATNCISLVCEKTYVTTGTFKLTSIM